MDITSLIDGFLARYSANTARAYGEDLSLYLAYCEKHGVDPLEADRPHIDGFARDMESRGNRPTTVARRMSAVRQFYRVLHLDGVIESDPARDTRMPRVRTDRSEAVYLPADKMRALIEAAREESAEAHALVALMMGLGLRVSEACEIDVENMKRGAVTIRGKGGHHTAVSVPEPIAEIVKSTGRKSGPAIVRKDGSRMDRRTAQRVVKRVAAKAGVPEISPHDLRAAYITAALDQGLPLYQVQDMARHASPVTTEGYDRARYRRLDDGNEQMAGLLGL